MSEQSVDEKNSWDYTAIAQFYVNRPNYAESAIKKLCEFVGARMDADYSVADVGAGTGNLTIMLRDKVGKVLAVEPTKAMSDIGKEVTKDMPNVEWFEGTGEDTTLPDGSVDMATFGSSFSTTKRQLALKETFRILKPRGYFCCMWNHRDLEDPTQKQVEKIIKSFCPDYSHGSRREPQADVILASRLFNDVHFIEEDQIVEVPLDKYLDAWRSVKNVFWDLDTEEGQALFKKIFAKVEEELKPQAPLKLRYTTRIWIARKNE